MRSNSERQSRSHVAPAAGLFLGRADLYLSFAKMVMGGGPTLHHENRLPFQRADVRIRR